mgnify:CR=1 FL=1
MSLQKYIDTLKSKHHEIEEEIRLEMARKMPDFSVISGLKKKKLKIKDMMGRVERKTYLAEAAGT